MKRIFERLSLSSPKPLLLRKDINYRNFQNRRRLVIKRQFAFPLSVAKTKLRKGFIFYINITRYLITFATRV